MGIPGVEGTGDKDGAGFGERGDEEDTFADASRAVRCGRDGRGRFGFSESGCGDGCSRRLRGLLSRAGQIEG